MFPSGGSEKRCLLPKKGFATPRCIWRFCLFARGRVFRRFAAGFSAGSLQNGICSTGLPPPTANGSAHKAFPLRAICFRFFALYFYFSRRLPPRAFLRCFSCLRRSTAGFRKSPIKRILQRRTRKTRKFSPRTPPRCGSITRAFATNATIFCRPIMCRKHRFCAWRTALPRPISG